MEWQTVAQQFDIPGMPVECQEIFSGNINRTYEITFAMQDGQETYIFQRINTYVFKNPREVMSNILQVTEHIKTRLITETGSYQRRVLSFVTTPDGTPYVDDPLLGFWRAYRYVDNARAYDLIHNPYYFYEAGKAFGAFQGQLADFPAERLFETIPNFHNTVRRMDTFRQAVKANRAGRRSQVEAEIAFILDHAEEAGTIVHLLETGAIPQRVTHNDTKINNVLFDADTDRAICVIDLDTVMPGASAYDFGDAIRSGACTAAEDEENLSRVSLDLNLFESFTRGFIKETNGLLTPEEIELLPLGVKIITLELASRFLADYLDGDVYFKTSKPDHNLLRARTQIKLAQDIERKFSHMQVLLDTIFRETAASASL